MHFHNLHTTGFNCYYLCLIALLFNSLRMPSNAAIANSEVSKINLTNIQQSTTKVIPSLNTQVNNADNIDLALVNLSKTVRLKDILNIYDITYMTTQWLNIQSDLTKNCTKDMRQYLHGLKLGNIWAIKMDDASGHYTSGFFYGNNYWMGSLSLCSSIYRKDESKTDISNKIDLGLPFAKEHTHTYNRIAHKNPPFIPGFYIVKMSLNESYPITMIRNIYVGVCLPSTCSTEDVKTLSRYAQQPIASRDTNVLDVRMPTNQEFNIYEDRTFCILIVVCVLVLWLMFAGTLYEIHLAHQYKEALRQQDKELMNNSEASSGIGCASSDYCDSVIQETLKKESLKELNIVLNLPHGAENETINNCMSPEDRLGGHLHEAEKLSIYSELLLSFSIITNFNAICDRNVGSDTIPCIHGLRAFSMAWVILGHTCIVVFKYSDNMEMRKDVEQNFFFQAITNGPFSVDTFFFISGFLVSYLYFRTNAKGKLNKLTKGTNEFTAGAVHFLGLVAYRFMRLTTPYIFVLGVVQVTMKYLATYSIFDPPTMDHITCPKYWWRNVLYINTLFPVEDMCMLWSWYLANDTQFYIIGAIILIVAVRHFRFSAYTTIIFLISSWITTAIIAFNNNHRPNTDDPLALFDKIYDKPWTRLGPYLIGMTVGWMLFRTNCKIRISKLKVTIAWTLAMLNLLFLIFGLYRTELSQFTAAAYSSLSHSAWAVSLAWITIACSTGYGGYVNTLLSAPWLYPFSRVTYCAYLIHPIVIRSMALNSDAPLHLGGDIMAVMFFGLVVASYLLSFMVSLSFEAPVVTMLKILSPSRKKRIA